MTSAIDPTKPSAPMAYTADVRANFQAAHDEITALQAAGGGGDDSLPLTGGTLTGPLQLPAGARQDPSLLFGDPQSGFYRFGVNQIGVSLNGASAVYFAPDSGDGMVVQTHSELVGPVQFDAGFTAYGAVSFNDSVTLGRDPSAPMEAVTLQYLEAQIAALQARLDALTPPA